MNPGQTTLALNAQQIQSYRDDGFLVLEDFLSPDEINTLREAEASPAIQSKLEEMGIKDRTVHMLELTIRHPAFLELARDPRSSDASSLFSGRTSSFSIRSWRPNPCRKAWAHLAGIRISFYPHTNTSLLAVFVYLDDATRERLHVHGPGQPPVGAVEPS